MPPQASAPAPPSQNLGQSSADYSNALNSQIQGMPALNQANIDATNQSINELGPSLLNWQNVSANANAANNFGIQSAYSPAYVNLANSELNQADPSEVALRQNLENSANQQLGLGTSLDPAYESQLQQSIRGAQAARGNSFGNSAGNAEALSTGEAGLAMQQERQQFAQGVSGQGGVSALYSTLPGFSNLSSPYSPESAPASASLSPSSILQGEANNNSLYGSELGFNSSAYGTATNAPNPWMQGLGLALGVGGTVAGSAFGGPLGGMAGGMLGGLASSALNGGGVTSLPGGGFSSFLPATAA